MFNNHNINDYTFFFIKHQPIFKLYIIRLSFDDVSNIHVPVYEFFLY